MRRRTFTPALRCLVVTATATLGQLAAATEPLLESYAEEHKAPTVRLPPAVLELVLPKDSVDRQSFHECMRDSGLRKGQEAQLFVASPVHLTGDSLPGYFVRPALKPYCIAFYGAHLFRYWFVAKEKTEGAARYRVVFESGGDGVKVLASRSSGWQDIQTISNTAISSTTITWQFNGDRYVKASCRVSEFADGQVAAEKACGVNPSLEPALQELRSFRAAHVER